MEYKGRSKKIKLNQAENLLLLAENEGVKTTKFAKDAMIKPVYLQPEDSSEIIIKKRIYKCMHSCYKG